MGKTAFVNRLAVFMLSLMLVLGSLPLAAFAEEGTAAILEETGATAQPDDKALPEETEGENTGEVTPADVTPADPTQEQQPVLYGIAPAVEPDTQITGVAAKKIALASSSIPDDDLAISSKNLLKLGLNLGNFTWVNDKTRKFNSYEFDNQDGIFSVNGLSGLSIKVEPSAEDTNTYSKLDADVSYRGVTSILIFVDIKIEGMSADEIKPFAIDVYLEKDGMECPGTRATFKGNLFGSDIFYITSYDDYVYVGRKNTFYAAHDNENLEIATEFVSVFASVKKGNYYTVKSHNTVPPEDKDFLKTHTQIIDVVNLELPANLDVKGVSFPEYGEEVHIYNAEKQYLGKNIKPGFVKPGTMPVSSKYYVSAYKFDETNVKKHKVKYDLNGGVGAVPIDNKEYFPGTKVEVNVWLYDKDTGEDIIMSKTGFDFMGYKA